MANTETESISKPAGLIELEKITAIITARGGSKGVLRKNIRDVDGKPLIAYTIEAALNCDFVESCYVTTEDQEIKKVSEHFGAQVIDRPEELARDNSLSQDAVYHAIEHISQTSRMMRHFVLMQPTSPLRSTHHLDDCLTKFFVTDCVSAVSVVEAEHHPWKMLLVEDGGVEPVHSFQSLEKPRQELPKACRVNGAIYVMPTALFMEKRRFFVNPVFPFFMSREDSLDIDTESDLKLAASIIKKRKELGLNV